MRSAASIMHLDLDAFFAAVEQRDKPSLRGKPVVVGGAGARGVVAAASYEARTFGLRSAMSGAEAHRRCPHAAFLGGRFEAYLQSSTVVMELLREISPVVEPLSLDEAYADLEASTWELLNLERHVQDVRQELSRRTAGLTASVGVGSSKLMAKLASEAAKPDSYRVIEPGTELDFRSDLPVRSIPGVGPTTEAKLLMIGIATVQELRTADPAELVRQLGTSSGELLLELAHGRDPRPVVAHREAKSISTEDTFEHDLTDPAQIGLLAQAYGEQVSGRLTRAGLFARTISVKVRFADFTTITRARSLEGSTDRAEAISRIAVELVRGVDTRPGVRLLGVAASNFTSVAQEPLFDHLTGSSEGVDTRQDAYEEVRHIAMAGARGAGWYPGADIEHEEFGRGWVWGSGLGRVTVRFETRDSGPGPIRTFELGDPALSRPSELPRLPGRGASLKSEHEV